MDKRFLCWNVFMLIFRPGLFLLKGLLICAMNDIKAWIIIHSPIMKQ